MEKKRPSRERSGRQVAIKCQGVTVSRDIKNLEILSLLKYRQKRITSRSLWGASLIFYRDNLSLAVTMRFTSFTVTGLLDFIIYLFHFFHHSCCLFLTAWCVPSGYSLRSIHCLSKGFYNYNYFLQDMCLRKRCIIIYSFLRDFQEPCKVNNGIGFID